MGIAEIGQVSRGTVIRVLPYGALVRLDDGTLGLVHISEIDERFVHNVADYVAPEARVVVKVLACKEGGKYEFSIKRAKGEVLPETLVDEFDAPHTFDAPEIGHSEIGHSEIGHSEIGHSEIGHSEIGHSEGAQLESSHWAPSRDSRAAFDEKLRDFLNDSGERLSDLKRHDDAKLHRRAR